MKHIVKVESLENLPETRPIIAMDAAGKIFQQKESLTPVGPSVNEIWYWGEYYDIESAIQVLQQMGMSYTGPTILSNEQVGDKYVITFNSHTTKLGIDSESGELYPIFTNISELGIICNITNIAIPNSVTSIGGYAFQNCSLTTVTIPNSVTSIGEFAFSDCYYLASVTIPNSVTIIGQDAFVYCSSLTSIDVAADNSNYCSVDDVLFNKDKTTLIQYPGGKQGIYIIPNNVTSIGQDAFSGCTGLTSVTIPNSVTSIGIYAFQECSLTSVTIPNSVTSIGNYAFEGCTGLTFITCKVVVPPTLDGPDVFYNTNEHLIICVPSQSVETYKAAEYWSEYADRIQAIQ